MTKVKMRALIVFQQLACLGNGYLRQDELGEVEKMAGSRLHRRLRVTAR